MQENQSAYNYPLYLLATAYDTFKVYSCLEIYLLLIP